MSKQIRWYVTSRHVRVPHLMMSSCIIIYFILPQIRKNTCTFLAQQFQFIFCKWANCFKCIVYSYTQILLYIGGELQSLVITMSSCSAQCVPGSRGSGWVEIKRRVYIVLSRLTSNSLQVTAKKGGWGDRKNKFHKRNWVVIRRQQLRYRLAFNHIRSNSSLILRCKTSAEVSGHFRTSAEVFCGHFGTGAEEVSWVRSVCTPFEQVTRPANRYPGVRVPIQQRVPDGLA